MKVKRKISKRVWEVESGDNVYTIWLDFRGFHCNCQFSIWNPEHMCKHVRFIKKEENIK